MSWVQPTAQADLKQEATEGAQAQRLVETLIEYYDEVRSPVHPPLVQRQLSLSGWGQSLDHPNGCWWSVQLFLYQWMRIGQLPLSRKATLAAGAWLRAHPPNDDSAPAAATSNKTRALSDSARQQLQGGQALAAGVSNLDLSQPPPSASAAATPLRDASSSSNNNNMEEDDDSAAEDDGTNEVTLTRRETVQRCVRPSLLFGLGGAGGTDRMLSAN